MKKLITLITVCFVFVGCQEGNLQGTNTQYTVSSGISEIPIKVYVIDSCEYIGRLTGGYSDVLTHKGNCKYCIERNKK